MRRDRLIALGLLGLTVFVWLVPLQYTVYGQATISDIPVYERVADRIAEGLIPFSDFDVEYPPGAVALFWLADLLPGSYATAFSGLMLASLIVTFLATLAICRTLDLSPRRTAGAGLVVACLPLLIGPLVETRFDLAFAAVLAWTGFAVASERFRLAWLLIGVGALVKIVSLAIVPLLLVVHLYRRGLRPAGSGVLSGAAVVLVGVLPFVLMSPGGVWRVLEYHLDRPLQIESLGGAYLLGLHALVGVEVNVVSSFGSQGFTSSGASVLAAISTGLMCLAIVAIAATVVVLLNRHGWDRMVALRGLAATIVALLALGKVLSPQFIVWLVPLGLLVTGRYARTAFALTVAACLGTLAYFPHHYFALVALHTGPISLLVLRDAILLALLAAIWPRPPLVRSGLMVHPSRGDLPAGAAERAMSARYLSD